MTQKVAEINALFKLIDDPDEEVFNTIADRLLVYGSPIIPDLEHLWENTLDEATLERIEMMIYKLRLQDLKDAFVKWKDDPNASLFEGALLVTQFYYPELTIDVLRHQMEKIRRNIWLELNNYLTPLEQANVIRNILYNKRSRSKLRKTRRVFNCCPTAIQKRQCHREYFIVCRIVPTIRNSGPFYQYSQTMYYCILHFGLGSRRNRSQPSGVYTILCGRHYRQRFFSKRFRSLYAQKQY